MENIFKPIVKKENLHPNFIEITHPERVGIRKRIEEWSKSFPDRDGKFIKEFQTTFNSSFWELYLHATFEHIGLNLSYKHSAPDFYVNNSFTVEAVITNNPQGKTPEWDTKEKFKKEYQKADTERLNDQINLSIERLSNSISKKYHKYKNSYSKLPHVKEKPFVIALASFEQPWFQNQALEAIQKVLYGEMSKYSEDTGYYKESFPYLKKENGSTIELGLFRNDKMKEVSAIIFSNTATVGKISAMEGGDGTVFTLEFSNGKTPHPDLKVTHKKEYNESLENGLHIFFNPYAERKLQCNEFIRTPQHIGLWDYSINHNTLIPHLDEGLIIQRQVLNINCKQNKKA